MTEMTTAELNEARIARRREKAVSAARAAAKNVKVGVADSMRIPGTFVGICSGPGCGVAVKGTLVPFSTDGWPTQEIAVERIRQHKVEHETGEIMEPRTEFLARHGLVAHPDGLRTLPSGVQEV